MLTYGAYTALKFLYEDIFCVCVCCCFYIGDRQTITSNNTWSLGECMN